MANTVLTSDIIVKEGLAVFANETPFLRGVNRQYDKTFQGYGAQSGQTIRVQKPIQYTTRTGKTASTQNLTEEKIDFTRASQIGIDLAFSSAELAQDIGTFSDKYIKPAMQTLASTIEANCLSLAYKGVNNVVGTAGTNPNSWQIVANAQARLDNLGAPQANRSVILSPLSRASLVNASVGYFNPQDQLRNQWVTGRMGEAAGFSFAATPNVARHTTGAFGDNTALVNDTFASGDSTISMDDFSNATPTLKEGDVFTVANVYAVNPITKISTGELYQFCVGADITGATNAINNVTLKEAVYSSGPLQNVNSLPANDAAITFIGTASTSYVQNIAYQKDAFIFGTIDLPLHNPATDSIQVMDGVSMRFMKYSDGRNDEIAYRFDVLYGFAVYEENFACRIVGA